MSTLYASHFGINNIPYGIANSTRHPQPQCVTRINDIVIFLADLADSGLFNNLSTPLSTIFRNSTLNDFAALPKANHADIRFSIQEAYKLNKLGISSESIEEVTLHLPVRIGDFTDFSASASHVQNAAEAILGTRSFPPAFHKYPVGYAGRCSSIEVSPSNVARPLGQFTDYSDPEKSIVFGPTRALDYELEVGAIIGRPVAPGTLLNAKDADEHIFGLVLVNDWSARDIQGLEMNPLGPFNGKNFATAISPWVVTMEALRPYTTPAPPRMSPVAGFLDDQESVNYKIGLEVELVRNGRNSTTCKVGFETMYWTFRHMLAHHTVGGCALRTGDLVASGTVSGEMEDEHGCLLELTLNGKKPWKMSDGSDLRYLEDGDMVKFTGVVGARGDGVGFGECVGKVISARKI
jgi:fumarylacetoacetase